MQMVGESMSAYVQVQQNRDCSKEIKMVCVCGGGGIKDHYEGVKMIQY